MPDVGDIVETSYDTGTCRRCGKEVWRDDASMRWTDQYGRNRCRADPDDGECDVGEVIPAVRRSRIAERSRARIMMFNRGDLVFDWTVDQDQDLTVQQPDGRDLTVTDIHVSVYRSQYKAAVRDENDQPALALRAD